MLAVVGPANTDKQKREIENFIEDIPEDKTCGVIVATDLNEVSVPKEYDWLYLWDGKSELRYFKIEALYLASLLKPKAGCLYFNENEKLNVLTKTKTFLDYYDGEDYRERLLRLGYENVLVKE